MSSNRLIECELECLFPGDSELAGLMRALDWSNTDLGPPESWPDNLCLAVSLCLTSRLPIVIYWGSDFTLLYNDACISYFGPTKHPRCLGQPASVGLAEIWNIMKPMLESVFTTAKATESQELRMFAARNLPLEEIFVRFTFSPILAGGGAAVDGVFCPCTEITEQIVGARRLETLRKLGANATHLQTVEVVFQTAAQVLADNPHDIPFAAIYLLDETQTQASLRASAGFFEDSCQLLPRSVLLTDDEPSPWALATVVRTQRAAEIADLSTLGQLPPGGLYPEPANKAFTLPIAAAVHDRLTGLLVVGVSPRCVLDAAYRTFFDLVAGQIGAAISAAKVYEAEQVLQQTEQRFVRFMQHLPGLAWIKDTQGRYVYANDAAEKAFRVPWARLYGKGDADIFPPETAAQFKENDRRALASGPGVRVIETLKHEDGIIHHSIVSKFPIPDRDGTATLIGGMAIDITELKRAEETLGIRARQQQAVAKLGELALRKRDLYDIFNYATTTVADTLDVEYCKILELLPGGEEMLLRAGVGWQEGLVGTARVHTGRDSQAGYTLLADAPVVVADLRMDKRFSGPPLLVEHGVVSGISCIIRRTDGTPWGVLGTHSTRRIAFTQDDVNFLVSIANILGDAIHRERTEQAIRESAEQLRLALEAGRMGTWEWHITTDEVIWSPNIESIHGLAPGSFDGTFAGYQKDVHPEDREHVFRAIRQTVEQGKDHHIEYRIIRPDGNIRWVEGRGKLFRDQGIANRMIGVCMDITDRKRAEQNTRFLADAGAILAEVTDYESTLQKIAGLAVPFFADWCAVDVAEADGSLRRLAVTHVDPAKVQLAYEIEKKYPLDPDAPVGALNILRTARPELVEAISDQLLVSSAQDEEHLRILRHLGLKSYIGVPLLSRGKVLGVLTFVTAGSSRRYDTADLRTAEDLAQRAVIAIENANLYWALKDADRRKDEFLAMLAHELRNPLAPLRNGLQLMNLAKNNSETVEQARVMMERQLGQMVRLIDDLLDLSRISRGKIILRKEHLPLATVVYQAIETSRPAIEQAGQEFTLSLPPEQITVDADATRLAQVFSNLLNNAAKFTAKNGHIWLTVQQEGSESVVSVRDNGVGIPADLLPKIFDMFTQVDRSLERSQGGLGIGLSLVKGLVEMHGGVVHAHSDGHGRGSEFRVRLPIDLSLAAKQPSDETKEPLRVAHRRILVVDDNQDAAISLAMMLQVMGNETKTAYDGLEAVATTAAFLPDIIFLDIGMPKLNGYDAARKIREQSWARNVVLVALTGWGQEDDRRRSQEAGFNFHMVKPVEPAALVKLLAGL